MLSFINAKINIGLYVTGLLPNGYHTLSTIFYPIGTANGTPANPEPFCDILEIVPNGKEEPEFYFSGNRIDCPPEKNLVAKSHNAFRSAIRDKGLPYIPCDIILQKAIPDGAGIGGGSADAAFTLRMLDSIHGNPLSRCELIALASAIGADVPFFIINQPSCAEGTGDILSPSTLSLKGYWIALVKNKESVSTAEAYRGVKISSAPEGYPDIASLPVKEWRGRIENMFEESVFARLPETGILKQRLYDCGAEYASMSGSGSAVFGIFSSREKACNALDNTNAAYKALILCER